MSYTFDNHRNFASTLVEVTPIPALSGSSLTVASGTGALFPTAPFNCVVCPANSKPTTTNAEIIRVTNVTGDVFTISRSQEASSARNILVGDLIYLAITVKSITDIESALSSITVDFNAVTPTAIGYANNASDFYSAAIGYANTASGTKSTAFGRMNVAHGYAASAFGYANTASGAYSSAFGAYNTASGYQGAALGFDNSASGISTVVVGYGVTSTTDYSVVIGTDTSTITITPDTITCDVALVASMGINTGNILLNEPTASSAALGVRSNGVDPVFDIQTEGGTPGIAIDKDLNILFYDGGNTRYKAGKGWQWYNNDTNLWHTKMCVGDPPQDGWDAGEV